MTLMRAEWIMMRELGCGRSRYNTALFRRGYWRQRPIRSRAMAVGAPGTAGLFAAEPRPGAGVGVFGEQMPFDTLDLVLGHLLAFDQDMSQSVLRDRASLARGAVQERHGGAFVAFDAAAVEQREGVFDLGIEIVGECGGAEQLCGFDRVFLDTAAVLVKGRQRVLCFRNSFIRRLTEQFGGALEVLRKHQAIEKPQAEKLD